MKHYKIMYDQPDAAGPYTLAGYSMFTDFPQVAEDWVKSVQPGYPNLSLRLNDPDQQAIADALNGIEVGEDFDFDDFYHEPLPYSAPQYGDEPHHSNFKG